jgi:penicillin-insensitive murein endopeptidase
MTDRRRKQNKQRLVLPLFAALPGLAVSGCFGTPTPLAPGLAGSVGWPHHGVQTGAIELPEQGPGFARFRSQGPYHWGQPSLVNGIQDAAGAVDRDLPGGAPLVVGDLSAQKGGKISRHYTHRSGRDVDLLWYVTTLDGVSVRNPSFVPLGNDGLAHISHGRGYVRLDVPREWRLIKALLTSRHMQVQWLFASSVVEALVVDYALALAEDPELIRRVQSVMNEPADGLPHDDHLHLRIACSPEASVQGCEGGGPYWDWLPAPAALQPLDADDLQQLNARGI